MILNETTESRLLSKVEMVPECGCWLWTGYANPRGYGMMSMPQQSPKLAHRVSWTLYRGPVPDGMFVCHKCDTPACVNPDHLFVGSNADNVKDMDGKGRRKNSPKHGESHPMARISNEVALSIFNDSGKHAEIAARHGVKIGTVDQIKTGIQWSSVTGKVYRRTYVTKRSSNFDAPA